MSLYPVTHYRLDENRRVVPVLINSEMALASWASEVFGKSHHVAYTEATPGITVSTIFLGLDCRHWGGGPPLVFETMVFDDYGAGERHRYATWDEALTGHNACVMRIKEAQKRAVERAEPKKAV